MSSPVINPDSFKFLKAIKANNNRPWFEKHREAFDEVKNNFSAFVRELISELRKFNPDIEPLEAKNCVYRIYRDVRFSKDKSPYKHHLAASISRGGRKSPFAGYYLHVEPNGNSYFGGGVWRPEKDVLNKIRQEIDYNQKPFEKMVLDKKFKAAFGKMYEDRMSNPPKNYSKDDPAIEWLKYKSYIYGTDIKDAEVLNKDFFKRTVKTAKTLSPFLHFLNTAISG